MSQFAGRYYYRSLAGTQAGETIILDGAEGSHLTRARRASTGTRIELFDGEGCAANGEVTALPKKGVAEVRVEAPVRHQAPSPGIDVVCAVSKGDRTDTMLDMLTQVGVDRVTFVEFARSVRKPGEKNYARWKRLLLEASKQSRREYLPTLEPATDFVAWLNAWQADDSCLALVAEPGAGNLAQLATQPTPLRVVVVIGPEGGLTDAELMQLDVKGFQPVSVAAPIMRIETAAVAFVAALVSCFRS